MLPPPPPFKLLGGAWPPCPPPPLPTPMLSTHIYYNFLSTAELDSGAPEKNDGAQCSTFNECKSKLCFKCPGDEQTMCYRGKLFSRLR